MDCRDNCRDNCRSDGSDQEIDGFDESSSAAVAASDDAVGSGGEPIVSMMERSRVFMLGECDGDLLLQISDREDGVLQWLHALDIQFMGACRADERLKPLLKLSTASGGGAEDPLLARLSQHFVPSEVGTLVRCFCMPLVSVRVGKVVKQGTTLCPTSIRGNLILALLPTSDFRLSFIGENGRTQRLVTLGGASKNSRVTIGEIYEDTSGRSFLVNVSDRNTFYFWCSEKSKLLGAELLGKMRDLLQRRPSVADLTGISESRLEHFATPLRGYLLRLVGDNGDDRYSGVPTPCVVSTRTLQPSPSPISLRSRHSSNQAARANFLCQGSLSPRVNSFKEGLPRSLSMRNAREKLRKLGENPLAAVENLSASSPIPADTSSSSCTDDGEPLESSKFNPSAEWCFLESLGGWKLSHSSSQSYRASSECRPGFAPYYCWCPPSSSAFKPLTVSTGISTLFEEPLIPSLSSLLPVVSPSLFIPAPSINLTDLPQLELPALLSEPLARLHIPNPRRVPTFTPLICEPIVHVPVIDVCSVGQGYLVSTGPSITTVIAPNLMNPLIPKTSSAIEESARETLRILISSSTGNNNMNVGLASMFGKTLDSEGKLNQDDEDEECQV